LSVASRYINIDQSIYKDVSFASQYIELVTQVGTYLHGVLWRMIHGKRPRLNIVHLLNANNNWVNQSNYNLLVCLFVAICRFATSAPYVLLEDVILQLNFFGEALQHVVVSVESTRLHLWFNDQLASRYQLCCTTCALVGLATSSSF
jgi:hypothetical protein